MLTGSYVKRLNADLVRWTAEGLLSADSAGAIRRSLEKDAGWRLPGLLGLFGGLLIAASVAAFVAANWEAIPRLVKLGAILASVVVALALSWRLGRQDGARGADAAATCAVLVFAAGIALISQMYHLPSDWPSGSLLVALGALAVALLLRSDGALVIAFAGLAAWSVGRWTGDSGNAQPAFLLAYLPAFWIALGRSSRLVHHAAVLALAFWLGMLPGSWLIGRFDFGIVAYGLAVSVVFVALGSIVLDRGGPALLSAFLPYGLLGLIGGLGIELVRILDLQGSRAGSASWPVMVAYAFAVASVLALGLAARDRRFALPLAGALLAALVVPLVFWTGGVVWLPFKIVVAALVLGVAMALVAAGAAGGVRRLLMAGSLLFGLAVMILLWQTIGTLLDQSLFFLVAGAVLLGLASAARRMMARLTKPQETAP